MRLPTSAPMVHRRDRPGLTAITESSPEVCPCSLPGKQGRVRSSDSAWQSHWHWHRQLAGDQNCTDKNRSCQAAGCILRPGPGQVNGTGTRNLKPAERRPCPCTVQSRSESDGRRPVTRATPFSLKFCLAGPGTTSDPKSAVHLQMPVILFCKCKPRFQILLVRQSICLATHSSPFLPLELWGSRPSVFY